jgi:hypothetical protein
MSQITLQYQPTDLQSLHFFKCVTLIIKSYKYFHSHNNDEWVLFTEIIQTSIKSFGQTAMSRCKNPPFQSIFQ